jgi:transcriptional regulator with XRE-family HTH domain
MSSTEHVIQALKLARQEKRLSQRELGAKAGVPQGHISKIETGRVDLKLSSLIGLARILGLEVMLVPRKLVPAVETLARSGGPEQALRPAYILGDGDDDA